ncbi:probable chitinase 10 isoform X2 [Episyrphus balteatus]|uniref:probable chitinase 10 isoform X2 n=1 Tax=Episyrphus balteatus TaxID=286459 RepID=UPI002485E48A|nr:probable chitinase 10 isoform X2 [Episyrphus balteatus]
MKVLIGIILLCFASVNCAVLKETNEEIYERITKDCDDSFFGRYIDPFNCQSYNRCLMGVLVKKDCPVGLGYDRKSQVCKPQVQGCTITGIPKEETNEEILERFTEECADGANAKQRFIDPFNCQSYYRCDVSRVLVKKDCPVGLGYDPESQVCKPQVQGCSITGIPKEETNEEYMERITEECEDFMNGQKRFIDPFNCQSYIRCVRRVLVKKDCPVGLGYDPESQVCKPQVQGCSITGIPKEETKEEILERITEECADGVNPKKKFIDPFNRERYYICASGVLDFNDCDIDICFDPKLEKCTPEACSKK